MKTMDAKMFTLTVGPTREVTARQLAAEDSRFEIVVDPDKKPDEMELRGNYDISSNDKPEWAKYPMLKPYDDKPMREFTDALQVVAKFFPDAEKEARSMKAFQDEIDSEKLKRS